MRIKLTRVEYDETYKSSLAIPFPYNTNGFQLQEKFFINNNGLKFRIGLFIDHVGDYLFNKDVCDGILVYNDKLYKISSLSTFIDDICLCKYKHFTYFELHLNTSIVKLGLDMKPFKNMLRLYLIKLIN